jgi:superfamily II DNA or RNA helicase
MSALPRPPLLDALALLKPNVIYTMAPPKAIASAANAFSQGAVSRFRWGGSGLLLEAVMGADEDAPAVRFTCPDGSLQSVCDCGVSGSCRHVLSAAMTIARVVHDAKFHRTDLSPITVAKFRQQLRLDEPEAPRARVIFQQRSAGVYEIDYDSGSRQPSWRVSEPPAGMEWLRWQEQQPERVAEAFCAWLETRPAVEIEVESSGGTKILKQPATQTLSARTGLAVVEKTVEIHRAILEESGKATEAFLDLGYGLALLTASGVFVRIHPREEWAEFSRWNGATKGTLKLPVAEFNASHNLKPGGAFTLLDGRNQPASPRPAEARASISVLRGEGGALVALRAVDEGELPVHGAFAKTLAALFDDGPYALLVKSPGRRRALAEALVRALLVTDEDVDALLREISHIPAFVSPSMHGDDAAKCVRHLLAGLRDLDGDRLLADSEAGENPWVCASGSGRALGLATVAFVEAFPEADFFRTRDLVATLAATEFVGGLRRLIAACERRGVALQVDEGAVHAAKLEIRVKARRSEALDWFELHSEARAGTLTLPRYRWDEILRSGSFRGEDGVLVVLDETSLALLQRAADIMEPGESRLPRLRLFDWLALRADGVECELPAEDEEILSSLQTLSGIPSCPLPKGLSADLREYQRHGYEWLAFLYRHRFGACLADDMGLGKTLQAITLLAALKEGVVPRQSSAPHLLVLPPTLLFNWQSEIARFAPGLKVHEYTGQSRSADFAGADVVMTTYELARRDIEKLAAMEFDIVIFDEAQAVKNFAAARTQALVQIRARFRLCLTGTPLENHVGEFHSIMEMAVPGVFGDRRSFLRRHEEGHPVLQRARPFLLRRTKEKILAELPPKIESDFYFPLCPTQKECYTRAVGEVRSEVLAAYEDRPAQQAGIMALAALTRLRQICISPALLSKDLDPGSPKIDHLVAQLTELAEEGHAALVFSQFVRALDLVSTALDTAGLGHLRLDGSTPTAKRKDLVSSFQDGTSPGIFLISLKTGGAGLNLTRASYVYHLDPWWNPAVERQASDRAHRFGQKNSVNIQRLVMRHTVEEKMMALKERKSALFAAIVDQGEVAAPTGAAGITAADFQFLVAD